ncbi:MAG: hypothetical protein N2Z70_02820 [Bdellovibrionaceae bacterium]|jgi:hypothetical protein|nr:hypothetical protein [Pseudobdellovibrionaceae bacterium]
MIRLIDTLVKDKTWKVFPLAALAVLFSSCQSFDREKNSSSPTPESLNISSRFKEIATYKNTEQSAPANHPTARESLPPNKTTHKPSPYAARPE